MNTRAANVFSLGCMVIEEPKLLVLAFSFLPCLVYLQ